MRPSDFVVLALFAAAMPVMSLTPAEYERREALIYARLAARDSLFPDLAARATVQDGSGALGWFDVAKWGFKGAKDLIDAHDKKKKKDQKKGKKHRREFDLSTHSVSQGSGAVDWDGLVHDGVHVAEDIFDDGGKNKDDKRELYDLMARAVPMGSGAVDWEGLATDGVHVVHDIFDDSDKKKDGKRELYDLIVRSTGIPQGSGAVDWEGLATDGVRVVHDIFDDGNEKKSRRDIYEHSRSPMPAGLRKPGRLGY